jgi:uncharacterized membrane protein
MAFCANCGAAVDGRFCQKCGAPASAPGAGPAPAADVNPPGVNPPGVNPIGVNPLPPPGGATAVSMNDNMAGALCYLFGFITGILFLVLAPYNQNREIRFHAFQSIFLNIAWFALWIVATIISLALTFIPFLGTFISIVLHLALGLGGFIVWLYMMFKTYNGEKIVLPVVGPLADKQAGV